MENDNETFDLPTVTKVYIDPDVNGVLVQYDIGPYGEFECTLLEWYQIYWDVLRTDEHTVLKIDNETGIVAVHFDVRHETCELTLEEYITYNPRFLNAIFIDKHYCGRSGTFWSNAYPDDVVSGYKVEWRGYLTCVP
jgi:hypothetical protein